MTRRTAGVFVLLVCASVAGFAQSASSDDEKLVREFAKKLAKERDPKERVSAARWLGGRANPEAVSALAKALSDPDAKVRQAAASALWDTGEKAAAAKPELMKALEDPEAAVVARAAGALASMDVPDAELAPAWRRALDGARDDATAFVSARGLIGTDPGERLAPPILAWLSKNAETAARGVAGRSILDERNSAENAGKALQRLLSKEKDPGRLLPLLDETVAKSPNSGRYVLGAVASLKTPPRGSVDLALAHTRSSVAETRHAAINLAGKVTAEKEAARWIPEATRLLADPDESVRMEACWALKGVKGLASEAAPELARLVSADPAAGVRSRAAETLGEIGNVNNPMPKAAKVSVAAAGKDVLARAMKDKDHDLAPAAVGAYNVLHIDNAELTASLADAAANGADSYARQRALLCLRNRQGQSKAVLETIRPLTKSPDKVVADDAKTAIEWIERGGSGSPEAIRSGSGAAAPRAASKETASPREAASKEPSSGGREQHGLAALRERNLEFNEPSYYRSLSEGDLEAVRAYLDGGMSANHVFVDSNKRTPLMVTFFGGGGCSDPENGRAVVRLLLDRGADVNAADEKKNTALMFAADRCDRQTLRMLLKAGAKLNAKNWSNLTALEMGIVSGNPGLEELIAAGARLDAEKAKAYTEAYKKNPKALELVRKASTK